MVGRHVKRKRGLWGFFAQLGLGLYRFAVVLSAIIVLSYAAYKIFDASIKLAADGQTAEAVSYTPSGTTVKGGTDEVEVKSVALLMSNAVGISLRGTAASAEPSLDVFVNGQKVTDFCGISVSEADEAQDLAKVAAEKKLLLNQMPF